MDIGIYDNIPEELKNMDRWVNWKLDDKERKIPINARTGYNASVSNPKTWTSFNTAVKQSAKYDGIGFILGNGYIGVDIDNANNDITDYKAGGKNNIVHEFIDQLESYAEYSQSGNGIHIILKGNKLPGDRKRNGDVEMYSDNRYFIMTGNLASQYTEIESSTEALKGLYNKYLEPKKQEPKSVCPQQEQGLVDIPTTEIIQLIENSKQKEIFTDLYCGNWGNHYNSQSEADLALCNILTFWTGNDPIKIDSIFKESGLYREKWDREDYKNRTINKAIADCTKVYYKYEAKKDTKKSVGTGEQSDTRALNKYTCYSNYIKNIEKYKPIYEIPNKTNGNINVNAGLLTNHIITHIPSIRVAGQMYVYNNGVYERMNYNEHKGYVKDHISIFNQSISLINNVSSMWALDNSIQKEPDETNNNTYLLNLKNGLYNLKTNKLESHTYKELTTIQVRASYDPKAKGQVFNQFINKVVPNKEIQLILQEILGYSISNFNNAKKAFILHGESDTGKSTFLNLITDLLGITNISSVPFQELGGRFSTANLYNKTVNICADLSNAPLNDDSVFKQLTGGDMVDAEFKGQDGFTFKNRAKLIFSTNELPQNYGDNGTAFYNRLMIIPFEQIIPTSEQDKELDKKLKKELDYIFMWALDGLKRLLKNDMKFTKTLEVENQLNNYKVSKLDNTLELIFELMERDFLRNGEHYGYVNRGTELGLHTTKIYEIIIPYINKYLSEAEKRAFHLNRKDFQDTIQRENYFITNKAVNGVGRCYVIESSRFKRENNIYNIINDKITFQ